jgi:cation diffusion facilitator family transporter
MHTQSVSKWEHEHTFKQDRMREGERKTLIVIAITITMMVVEIVAGILFGSMALLADGLHMGSHATALSISAVAYVYARKYAKDRKFSFGTGKVNALAGFSSAVLLVVFAVMMGWESVGRLIDPVAISFNQAILVSVVGLIVNLACMLILGRRSHHHHEHQAHEHEDADHNLRAAYLHVIADALTSLLAVFALLGGKFFGLNWMDPLMGIVGAGMVARWSWGLLGDTSGVLLDRQGPAEICEKVKSAIESVGDDRVCDLHLWSVGPGIYAASISIVAEEPHPGEYYKTLIPGDLGVVHTTVEVHRCLPDK